MCHDKHHSRTLYIFFRVMYSVSTNALSTHDMLRNVLHAGNIVINKVINPSHLRSVHTSGSERK